MIKATFTLYDEIRYLRFVVKGHAGENVKGHDIVCASASILLYTLAQTVDDMEQHGELTADPIVEMDEGDALITCHCNSDEAYTKAVTAFKTIWTGYTLLAHEYPQYVELTYVGKADKA